MRKRPVQSTREPRGAPLRPAPRGGSVRVAGLLVLAVGLGLGALLLAWHTAGSLPALRAARLDQDVLNAAFQQAHANLGADGRTAWALTITSRYFTNSFSDPDGLAERFADARATTAQLTRSQFGRVQLAAFQLLRLERDGVPPEQWWTHVSPYLSGLEQADLGHLLPELIDSYARTYERLGLGAGSAQRLAESFPADDHGPLLQYLASRIDLLAPAPADATSAPSPASAAHRVLERLLRAWVLAPGPAQLRLLAAELLAQRLERSVDGGAAPQARAAAQGLRAWRAAYRAGVAARPLSSPLLVVPYAPSTSAWAERWLGPLVLSALWTGAALVVCLALSITTAWGLLTRAAPSLTRRQLTGTAAAALLFAVAGLAWPFLAPAAAADDVHRITAVDTGWPHTPGIALLSAPAALAVVVARAGRGRRLRTLAGVAATATAVLALCLLLNTFALARGLARYERESAAIQRSGTLAYFAGADADRHLAELRAWEP